MNSVILLVESNPLFNALLKQNLEQTCSRILVIPALSASESRHILTTVHVDAVLCSSNLPDESGIDCLKHISGRFPNMPLFLIQNPASKDTGHSNFPTVSSIQDILTVITKALQLPPVTDAVRLSEEEVQLIIQQLRAFRHDLNNKMTVIGTASGFCKTNPDMAHKMLDIISGTLGPDNTILVSYAKAFDAISTILRVPPAIPIKK